MRLVQWTPAPLHHAPPAFETLREVTASVDEPLPIQSTARQLMRAAHLHCQKGGRTRSGGECLECARIVSIKPSPGRSYVDIRCLWTENDVVSEVMTRAFAVATIRLSDTLGHADRIAARAHVHHLLVVDRDEVIGVVCRCDLADPGSPAGLFPVAEYVGREMWTIPKTTSLAAAADAMERLEVGILMVTDGAELVGVVTMSDLGMTERGHGL